MIKCFVGDSYLISKELSFLESRKGNSLNYQETNSFGIEEVSFLTAFNFGDDKKTLVFSTVSLEKNDTLLQLLDDGIDNDYDLFIICNNIVKGRKLFNKLKALDALSFYEITSSVFSNLVKDTAKECGVDISDSVISLMKERTGFNYKAEVCGADIVNWTKRICANGVSEWSVAEIVPEHRNNSVWALKDAVLSGNSSKAMELVDTIMSDKHSSAIAVTSAVMSEVRVAYKLAIFSDRQTEVKSIINSNVQTRNCSHYSAEQLGRVFELLVNAVGKLKSGYEPTLLMKTVFSNCTVVLNGKM